MQATNYAEAMRLARAAATDAANKRMRQAGRSAWDADDFDHAADTMADLMTALGFAADGAE